jgi:arylsulfatase A-like enzyme
MMCRDDISSALKYACAAESSRLFVHLESLLGRFDERRDNLQADPRLATQPALQWLRSVDKRKPVFLWVHLFPPHAPYAAPAPWLGRYDSSNLARLAKDSDSVWNFLFSKLPPVRVHTLEARYDESVEYVDHFAVEFLDNALKILGDDTVVVVTADHGESFNHGYGEHMGPGLYEEVVRIPLLIRLPGQDRAHRRSLPAEQVDIAPTLAELAAIPIPPSWEGRSLVRELQASATAAAPSRPVFSMNFEQSARLSKLTTGSIAVIDGKWKLVRYLGSLHYPGMPPLFDALYDLNADPEELTNRAREDPQEFAHLSSMIAAELARHGTALP